MLKCRLLNVKLKPFQENIINLHNNISSKKKSLSIVNEEKRWEIFRDNIYTQTSKKKKIKKLGTPVKCVNTNFCLNNRTLPRDHEFYNYGYIYCNAHAKYLLSLPTKCTEKGRFFND